MLYITPYPHPKKKSLWMFCGDGLLLLLFFFMMYQFGCRDRRQDTPKKFVSHFRGPHSTVRYATNLLFGIILMINNSFCIYFYVEPYINRYLYGPSRTPVPTTDLLHATVYVVASPIF